MNNPEPAPIKNEHPPVWELVIEDMKERNKTGIAKYGTPLQPFNGRKVLVDAYQEALDLVVYLAQAIYEQECVHKFEEDKKDSLNRRMVICSTCGLEAVGLYTEDELYAVIIHKPIYEEVGEEYQCVQEELRIFIIGEETTVRIRSGNEVRSIKR